ncbi:MAG: ABC transporter permease subunit, partial [Pseudomonadota bacterium]
GFQFGLIIAGTVVIETVFAWPGMGRLFYQAVNARDYAVVQTIILLIAVSIILINLMVDLLYAVLDPRVRLTGSN